MSETKTRIYAVVDLNPDCSVAEIPVIKIRRQPRKGTVDIEESSGYSNYKKGTQKYECNTKQSPLMAVFYTAKTGSAGADRFEVEVFYPLHGLSQKVSFKVTIK